MNLFFSEDLRKEDDPDVDVESVVEADVDKESALEIAAKNLAQQIFNIIPRKNEAGCSDDDGEEDDNGEDVLSVDTIPKM